MDVTHYMFRIYRFENCCDDIQSYLDGKWEEDELHFIHVVYWFFNGPERREDFVPVDGEEYKQWKEKHFGTLNQ